MSYKLFIRCLVIAAVFISTQVQAAARNSITPTLSTEDVILQWNRVLLDTVRTPGQHPATIMQVRSYAIMHAAMFDAVNSIDGTHTPYLTNVPGTVNASIEAAAAQAAH